MLEDCLRCGTKFLVGLLACPHCRHPLGAVEPVAEVPVAEPEDVVAAPVPQAPELTTQAPSPPL